MCSTQLENPYVLVAGDKIQSVRELSPLLDQVKATGRPLLVFSTDLQKDPLSALLYCHKKQQIQTCAVNIPWQAGTELEVLQDIAILTGASFIDNRLVKGLHNVQLRDLGSCVRARVTHLQTELIGTKGQPHDIQQRVAELQVRIAGDHEMSATAKSLLQACPTS